MYFTFRIIRKIQLPVNRTHFFQYKFRYSDNSYNQFLADVKYPFVFGVVPFPMRIITLAIAPLEYQACAQDTETPVIYSYFYTRIVECAAKAKACENKPILGICIPNMGLFYNLRILASNDQPNFPIKIINYKPSIRPYPLQKHLCN